MALVTTKRNVDVLPGQAAPTVFHCSQHDVGATIILGLVNAGGNFAIPSGVTAIIQGSCSNGAVFTPVTATVSGSDITFNLSDEMTSIAGPTVCEAVLSKDADVLGTANFILDVEPSAMGSDTPPVFADAAWLWMVDKMGSETVFALGDKTVIDAINEKADQSDVTALSDAKLDKNQGTANAGKYLKVGADGNVETADLDVTTDKTLSIADKAADAKAVGDELDDLKADLSDIEDAVYRKALLNGWDTVDYESGFIDSGGNLISNSGFRSSVFISVNAGDTITYKLRGYLSTAWIITAYDSSYARIAGNSVVGANAWTEGTYTVEEGTSYVRICTNLGYSGEVFVSDNVYGTKHETIKDYVDSELENKVNIQQNTSDAGKLLGIGQDGKVKALSVQTEIEDNSITYDMLQKATLSDATTRVVDFWIYNNAKRTDGTSVEIAPEVDVIYSFPKVSVPGNYLYLIDDADDTIHRVDATSADYISTWDNTNEKRYYFYITKACKLYLPSRWNNTDYYSPDIKVSQVGEPHPINFLKPRWEPTIMQIEAKNPYRVFCKKGYNQGGTLQGLSFQPLTYKLQEIGWYKISHGTGIPSCILIDSNWDYIGYVASDFYNDGSIAYVHANSGAYDISPKYMGEGITSFGDMKVISQGDALDINKPYEKAVVCFGDSITSTGYPGKLAEIAKCVALNQGGSGDNSSKIRKKATGIGSESTTPFDWASNPVDTAILLIGYNDTYQGTIEGDIPTTNITDADNNWTDYLALFNASHPEAGTTTGNIGFIIEWLQANHPDVRILLCNYHNNMDTGKPYRYSDVDTAVKALSEYYGIKYIDIRRTSGINKKNATTYLSDGLHPNDAGQVLIAKAILREM